MEEIESLILTLANKSGLPYREIKSRIELKIEALGYLINDDVAVRLVAKDLGISLNQDKMERPVLKVEDLVPGLNNVNLKLTIERVGPIREFTKKDGTIGKLVKAEAFDETGNISLCFWDGNAEHSKNIIDGSNLYITSAYTRAGLDGRVEVHCGNKASIQIVEGGQPNGEPHKAKKGIIITTFDPINYIKKDGTIGRAVSFIFQNGNEQTRVIVWEPSDEMLFELQDGIEVEIKGVARKGYRGEEEIHINDLSMIKLGDPSPTEGKKDFKRLSMIQPEMFDFNVEGVIETDVQVLSTANGKNYAKILLRDGETVLPIVFWNDKAIQIKRIAKPGATLIVEGCCSKLDRYGLEVHVNKWSRIRIKENQP